MMQGKKRGCRYFLNLGMFSLVAIVIAYLLLMFIAHPLILSYGWAHPAHVSLEGYTPADFGLAYEDVELHTADNITLKGWYLPSQNGAAVILLHSIGANRLGVMHQAQLFQSYGYGVLFLDLRAHGESGGDVLPFGGNEGLDVVAAADYLTARGDIEHIAAMGFSLGGNFAVLGARADSRIEAIAVEGLGGTVGSDLGPQPPFWQVYDAIFFPLLRWHTGVSNPIAIGDALPDLTVPIFLLGAESEAEGLQRHAARNPHISLWIIPDVGHIGGISNPEYAAQLISFFDSSLGIRRE